MGCLFAIILTIALTYIGYATAGPLGVFIGLCTALIIYSR